MMKNIKELFPFGMIFKLITRNFLDTGDNDFGGQILNRT